MICETRRRLKEWGRWACGGEPSLSSMFKSMLGRGGGDFRETPAHIEEVDLIVRKGPANVRAILIKFYTQNGTFVDKALSLGLSRHSLRKRIEHAEYYVNQCLDEPDLHPTLLL